MCISKALREGSTVERSSPCLVMMAVFKKKKNLSQSSKTMYNKRMRLRCSLFVQKELFQCAWASLDDHLQYQMLGFSSLPLYLKTGPPLFSTPSHTSSFLSPRVTSNSQQSRHSWKSVVYAKEVNNSEQIFLPDHTQVTKVTKSGVYTD